MTRTTHRRAARIALAGLIVILGSAIATARADVKAQRDLKFDFTSLKTWSWDPSSPGDVRLALTAHERPEPIKERWEPVILQAVGERLVARGYPAASSGAPDFHLIYYLFVTIGSMSQELGQFLPANAQWHMWPITPQTTAVEFYPQGALVVDALSTTTGKVVWRGVAQAKLQEQNSDEKREQRLRAVIKDLMSKFPQKK
jgi:hypothetical protein